ncbi:hypothetical protein [Actinoplanes friuliensis]|nr:hypothetical protein [Actinoplanes friuliensis]
MGVPSAHGDGTPTEPRPNFIEVGPSRRRLAVLIVAGVLALAGCGSGGPAEPAGAPAVRTQAQARADVARYAGQTAGIIRTMTTNPVVTVAACAGGLYSVQAVYRLPLYVTRHAKARATLRAAWLANKLPITLDITVDGYRGAISTITPDGYTIDVVTITPRPRALSLQVRSPCLKKP